MAKLTVDIPAYCNGIDKLITDPKYMLTIEEMEEIMDIVFITACNNAAEAQGEDKKELIALMAAIRQIKANLTIMRVKESKKNEMMKYLEVIRDYIG